MDVSRNSVKYCEEKKDGRKKKTRTNVFRRGRLGGGGGEEKDRSETHLGRPHPVRGTPETYVS